MENNYFIARFDDDNDYIRVLTKGPWVELGHYLVVQRWHPSFNPCYNSLGKTRLLFGLESVTFPCIIITFYFIWRLGNKIGRALKIDENTLSQMEDDNAKTERGRYARVCVEVDLRRKWVPKVLVFNDLFQVEYEGFNLICFKCGR